MPTARTGLAAVAFNGKIYAMGGFGVSSMVLDTVEVYDPISNSWSTATSMPTARAALAATAVNGKICAIGGFNGGGVLNAVEVYDPSTNTWSTAAAGMPTARKGLAAADANGLIYAVGGANISGQVLNATEQYLQPATIFTFIKN